jgi:PqqD family protein of HPr-rel-A system
VALRRNPEVIAKRLDKATVLVDVPSGRIFELNETGTRIWELLGEGLDADSIMHHLVDEFEVEHSQAEDEVRRLLEQLRTEGLLDG